MAEYIDRQKVIARFTFEQGDYIPEKLIDGCDNVIAVRTIKRVLREMPAADVVQVVRCRECKHSTKPAKLTEIYGQPGTLTCHHGPCNRRNVNENDFCSYGER